MSGATEAIVLAGGLGTRLRAVVADVPKPMAPVAGKPFLDILLRMLARKGVRRVVLSVGHLGECISDHFGTAFAGMAIDYAIERRPLGTGGAARLALQRCADDRVLLLNGDTYLEFDADLVDAAWDARRLPVLVGCAVPDAARYGRLRIEDGRLTGFLEKGAAGPGVINGGCYLLPRTLLDGFAPGQAFSLETDFLAQAVQRGEFSVVVSGGAFIDIGVPDDYARAQHMLAQA